MAHPTIPTILTTGDWDKQKGIVAKVVAKDTGIGAAMTAVKNAYDAIKWDKYSSAALMPSATLWSPDQVDAIVKAAKEEYTQKIEECRKKLGTLKDLASKIAGEWKDKTLVPKSSTEHVKKIAEAADKLYLELKDNSSFYLEFAKAAAAVKLQLGTLAEKVKPGEKPTEWDYNWFLVRKPTAGFEDDPKLGVTMPFFFDHYKKYLALDRSSVDAEVIRSRINCLRQMIAGLDQTETKLKNLVSKCDANRHKNTKVALQEYLTLCTTYRNQRKAWLEMEKKKALTVPQVAKDLQEIIIGPGLDRL